MCSGRADAWGEMRDGASPLAIEAQPRGRGCGSRREHLQCDKESTGYSVRLGGRPYDLLTPRRARATVFGV